LLLEKLKKRQLKGKKPQTKTKSEEQIIQMEDLIA
jgi:hypothetical protein